MLQEGCAWATRRAGSDPGVLQSQAHQSQGARPGASGATPFSALINVDLVVQADIWVPRDSAPSIMSAGYGFKGSSG